jgi:hypothetical protein
MDLLFCPLGGHFDMCSLGQSQVGERGNSQNKEPKMT